MSVWEGGRRKLAGDMKNDFLKSMHSTGQAFVSQEDLRKAKSAVTVRVKAITC